MPEALTRELFNEIRTGRQYARRHHMRGAFTASPTLDQTSV